jgi:hypothetical protein
VVTVLRVYCCVGHAAYCPRRCSSTIYCTFSVQVNALCVCYALIKIVFCAGKYHFNCVLAPTCCNGYLAPTLPHRRRPAFPPRFLLRSEGPLSEVKSTKVLFVCPAEGGEGFWQDGWASRVGKRGYGSNAGRGVMAAVQEEGLWQHYHHSEQLSPSPVRSSASIITPTDKSSSASESPNAPLSVEPVLTGPANCGECVWCEAYTNRKGRWCAVAFVMNSSAAALYCGGMMGVLCVSMM